MLWRWVLIVRFVLVSIPIGLLVVASILGDADMLVDAGGWWMLLLFLLVPVLVVGPWLLGRVFEWRENRRWEREGSQILRDDPRFKADMERYESHLAGRGMKKVRAAKPRR